jgi:hypothetical protein
MGAWIILEPIPGNTLDSRRPAPSRRQGRSGSSQGWIIIWRNALIDFSRVANMAPAKPIVEKKRRYFTVEEANKALPLVRMILSDIVRQYRIVDDLQQRLSMVLRDRRRSTSDLYTEELAQSQAELEAEEAKLKSYIDELRRLGVEFKGPDGLCDFYSLMDGREVFLCWHLGEPEVLYWHDLDAGFAGRQPLPAHAV